MQNTEGLQESKEGKINVFKNNNNKKRENKKGKNTFFSLTFVAILDVFTSCEMSRDYSNL